MLIARPASADSDCSHARPHGPCGRVESEEQPKPRRSKFGLSPIPRNLLSHTTSCASISSVASLLRCRTGGKEECEECRDGQVLLEVHPQVSRELTLAARSQPTTSTEIPCAGRGAYRALRTARLTTRVQAEKSRSRSRWYVSRFLLHPVNESSLVASLHCGAWSRDAAA